MNETQLESFVKDKGLHPYGVIDIQGSRVFIAETELETNKPNEYPWGYYQVAWFVSSSISHGNIDGGSWVEFEAMHDKDEGWTQEEKRQRRIQAGIDNAREWIELNIKAGRYESH